MMLDLCRSCHRLWDGCSNRRIANRFGDREYYTQTGHVRSHRKTELKEKWCAERYKKRYVQLKTLKEEQNKKLLAILRSKVESRSRIEEAFPNDSPSDNKDLTAVSGVPDALRGQISGTEDTFICKCGHEKKDHYEEGNALIRNEDEKGFHACACCDKCKEYREKVN